MLLVPVTRAAAAARPAVDHEEAWLDVCTFAPSGGFR